MSVKSKPAQEFVNIKDVRDGVAILKDGRMIMVLMVSTINFALKSEDEKAATLLQFQTFLNSLEFSTQIYIQSRRLDIKPYLNLLRERLKDDVSSLMRIQIEEYITFIKNFTDNSNIMTKTFFIVIPYSTTLGAKALSATGQNAEQNEKSAEQFQNVRTQLEQRANIVKQGLTRTGLRVMPLGTDEIVELYYRIFNPAATGNAIKI